MQSTRILEREFVLVEHEFEYTAKDGRVITIKPNERYILLKKTNEHWWHVCHDNKSKPFYIPAKYVKVLTSQSLSANGCQPYNVQCEEVAGDVPRIQYSYAYLPSDQQINSDGLSSLHRQEIKSNDNLAIVTANRTGVSNSQNVSGEQKIGTSHTLPPAGMQKTSPKNNLPTSGLQTMSPHDMFSTSGMQRMIENNIQPAVTTLTATTTERMAPVTKMPPVSDPWNNPYNTLPVTSAQRTSPVNIQPVTSAPRNNPVNTLPETSSQRSSPGNTLPATNAQRTSPVNILPVTSALRSSPVNTQPTSSMQRSTLSNSLSATSLPGISISSPFLSTIGQTTIKSNRLPGSNGQQRTTVLSGSSRSLTESSVLCEYPTADTMQIFVEEQTTCRTHTPMRTFHNSKKILDSKKRISFALPPDLQPTIRPTQSLNDLQTIIYELPASHPPAPESSKKPESSQTQQVDPMQTNLGRRVPASSPDQAVNEEEEPANVYANLEQFQKDNVRDRLPSQQHSSTSTLDDWETHTDQDSGNIFYYNSSTGETTWDSPFDQPEDQINSPVSPVSLSPQPEDSDWEKHFDEANQKFYFYNSVTGVTSWDPPMEELNLQSGQSVFGYGSMDRRPPTPETDYPDLPEADYDDDYPPLYNAIPPNKHSSEEQLKGWSFQINKEGKKIYKNNFNNETWLQSQDMNGKIYFYTPDGSSSQWHLPELIPPDYDRSYSESDQDNNIFLSLPPTLSAYSYQKDTDVFMPGHKRSDSDNNFLTPGSQQTKSLIKAGVLQKAKVLENGKRVRKNWSSSWTVLEGGVLTFFKDGKNSSSNSLKQSSLTVPEYTVNLQGASIIWATKEKSSKKNVLELKTLDGSQYLIHHDSESITKDWYISISNSIGKSVHTSTEKATDSDAESPRLFGSSERLGFKDEKDKKALGQYNTTSSSDSDRNVRNKLKKLLQRRPTLQSLRDKGYIKDQVFGCPLHHLCERERTDVPLFVTKCIQAVEKRGLDIDGLYRVSGNLAIIQKLRYKVDHDENFNLDDGRWEDVHVITGALKLFFRELPEPLFPFTHFDSFVEAIKMSDQIQKIRRIKELVQSLPPANLETMRVLFKHLCSVIEYRESNRMSVQSISIVFGPTLLRPETENGYIAMYMVFQNQIVEHILNQYKNIFNIS